MAPPKSPQLFMQRSRLLFGLTSKHRISPLRPPPAGDRRWRRDHHLSLAKPYVTGGPRNSPHPPDLSSAVVHALSSSFHDAPGAPPVSWRLFTRFSPVKTVRVTRQRRRRIKKRWEGKSESARRGKGKAGKAQSLPGASSLVVVVVHAAAGESS
jgi:hypothetical protein